MEAHQRPSPTWDYMPNSANQNHSTYFTPPKDPSAATKGKGISQEKGFPESISELQGADAL